MSGPLFHTSNVSQIIQRNQQITMLIEAIGITMADSKLDDGRDAAEKACGPQACDIQSCLQKHGYNISACQSVVDSYSSCVEAHRQAARPVVVATK